MYADNVLNKCKSNPSFPFQPEEGRDVPRQHLDDEAGVSDGEGVQAPAAQVSDLRLLRLVLQLQAPPPQRAPAGARRGPEHRGPRGHGLRGRDDGDGDDGAPHGRHGQVAGKIKMTTANME